MPPPRFARWLVLCTSSLTLGVGVAQVVTAPPQPHVTTTLAAPPAAMVPTLTPPQPAEPEPLAALPAPAPAPRPVAARHAPPRPRPTRRAVARPSGPDFQQQVRSEVARIPYYQAALAHWVVVRGLSRYGLTDRTTGTVYLSTRIPPRLLYSVVVHEWGHVISTYAYGGDLAAGDAAMMRWYGASSPAIAIELAADCIARELGATWTHYTACSDGHWQLGARYLMVGWPLPESTTTTRS